MLILPIRAYVCQFDLSIIPLRTNLYLALNNQASIQCITRKGESLTYLSAPNVCVPHTHTHTQVYARFHHLFHLAVFASYEFVFWFPGIEVTQKKRFFPTRAIDATRVVRAIIHLSIHISIHQRRTSSAYTARSHTPRTIATRTQSHTHTHMTHTHNTRSPADPICIFYCARPQSRTEMSVSNVTRSHGR